MTAVLERIDKALTARPATEHVRRDDDLAWVASFAPPVVSGGRCPCGSVFEARSSQIDATDDEKLAAAEAVAELFGRALLDVDLQVVARVIDKINHERASGDHDALMEWSDAHTYCGVDL